MGAIEDIRMVSGELAKARFERHLRTLTGGAQGNTDIALYRTEGGRLVICTSPADDGQAIPCVDPSAVLADYGVIEC